MGFEQALQNNSGVVNMKKAKIYIVTYKRTDILNDTLDRLFESDFPVDDTTEVNIINNHTQFDLAERHKSCVSVLHNVVRPDWSNGNLAENWNQALINGFKSLSNPDCQYIITLQNDTSLHPQWWSNLMTMHKKFNFIVGQYGDNIVSYTPEAVKRIGMWDENFTGVQYKEADYWIRALAWNREGSMINDTLHGLELNNRGALPLDVTDGRNFQEESGFRGSNTLKRKADDSEHRAIWSTRGGVYKDLSWKYFVYKWAGTWKKNPEKSGWVKNWSKEFIQSPPDPSRSQVTQFMRYIYFEKDLYSHAQKRYLT